MAKNNGTDFISHFSVYLYNILEASFREVRLLSTDYVTGARVTGEFTVAKNKLCHETQYILNYSRDCMDNIPSIGWIQNGGRVYVP